jgi:hypothetical protein
MMNIDTYKDTLSMFKALFLVKSQNIDTNIDSVSMYSSRRKLCPSEMKLNAWTNAWTKCPCSKY